MSSEAQASGTPATQATDNALTGGSAVTTPPSSTPPAPAVPAGHRIVKDEEWAAAQEALGVYKAWQPAIDVLNREKLTAEDIQKTFAPEPPKAKAPDGAVNPAFIQNAVRTELALEKHNDAMGREPEAITGIVDSIVPQNANDSIKQILSMAASAQAEKMREAYPAGHPLAGQKAPLSAAKQKELKAWVDTEGKKLIGSLAISTTKPGAVAPAGLQAPSGSPGNAPPAHISKWSQRDKVANAEGVLARLQAGM